MDSKMKMPAITDTDRKTFGRYLRQHCGEAVELEKFPSKIITTAYTQ